MPCGKRPLVKNWDKPRNIRVITPSKYEQNEASVKIHWKKVIRDLELSYKDDQFWDSQYKLVRELVGDTLYLRLAKIFNLPKDPEKYVCHSENSVSLPSEEYYHMGTSSATMAARPAYSMSVVDLSAEEEIEEEESEQWTISSQRSENKMQMSRKSFVRSSTKTMSRLMSTKSSISKFQMSKVFGVSRVSSSRIEQAMSSTDTSARTDDDVMVHRGSKTPKKPLRRHRTINPYFIMLYCNESETDMIKWKSKYKQKGFEVSASDEFNKKAEIMTKKISLEFFDWWLSLGNVEFKSEIRRPEDIEELFQVWFDEHASRGIKMDPKILPCVLQSIANYVGVPKTACPKVLQRQIAHDIHAETSPAHIMAFGTALPHKMKHIPARNNTAEMWHKVRIPEDLRSMTCVFDNVMHLTSTKSFQKWLKKQPSCPMPPCLKTLDAVDVTKKKLVVPSGYFMREKSLGSMEEDLALPVSEFALELKDVLSQLLNN